MLNTYLSTTTTCRLSTAQLAEAEELIRKPTNDRSDRLRYRIEGIGIYFILFYVSYKWNGSKRTSKTVSKPQIPK